MREHRKHKEKTGKPAEKTTTRNLPVQTTDVGLTTLPTERIYIAISDTYNLWVQTLRSSPSEYLLRLFANWCRLHRSLCASPPNASSFARLLGRSSVKWLICWPVDTCPVDHQQTIPLILWKTNMNMKRLVNLKKVHKIFKMIFLPSKHSSKKITKWFFLPSNPRENQEKPRSQKKNCQKLENTWKKTKSWGCANAWHVSAARRTTWRTLRNKKVASAGALKIPVN